MSENFLNPTAILLYNFPSRLGLLSLCCFCSCSFCWRQKWSDQFRLSI